ncbi:MAG TPA: type III pantothenate kinase [Opitutaceae bacterium]
MLLCIDIGNTHAHFGLLTEERTVMQDTVPTRLSGDPTEGIAAQVPVLQARFGAIRAVAFCSVVPAVNATLRHSFTRTGLPVWQLTHEQRLGVPITYSNPAEIGQDRLANSAGAHALGGSPAVVIDIGTAVTFDVVTRAGGYEGGVIGPGVAVMRNYLHERTAQLPRLDESLEVTRAIGKSTVEAMRIGTVLGYAGMIQALLDAVLAELAGRGEPAPALYLTGGAAAIVAGRLRQPVQEVPDLTLRGLAAAWQLNH